jgi:hypothetical protein
MSAVTLNGQPVLSLSLSLPLSGAWSANVEVASGAAPAPGAAAFLQLPGQSLEGLVKRSGAFGERAQLRVIGGLVDWEERLEAKNYQNTNVSTVLEDMSVETDQSVSDALAFWSRREGTRREALQTVAEHLGLNWRINPDGTVRLRAEAPATVNPGAVELERDEARGLVTLALERAVVLPGTLVGNDSVGDVLYEAGSDFRCRYRTNSNGGLRVLFENLVRRITRDTLYLGTYTAEVVRQAADGTLDLMPFDQRLRSTGLQSVPIRNGLPGVSEITVPTGELVLLSFDGGSPAQPYASVFHKGKATKLVLDIESVEIGGTVAVALATLVKAELDRMATVFDSHVHAVAAAPGTTATTLTPMSPVSEIASQKLKTE